MNVISERAANIIREHSGTEEGRSALIALFAAISACHTTLDINGLKGDERVVKVLHDAADLLSPVCEKCSAQGKNEGTK